MAKKKVIIIGGGFGGLNCAKGLKKTDFDILLLDRNNHHTFQPLLYQVATAALSSSDIAIPIREILRKQENATVYLCNIDSIDVENKSVKASNGEIFYFDYLIVATGARHSYFGHPEWEEYAPGLKTLPDAIAIREKILLSFELAERTHSHDIAEQFLRFVIVGGGPTGVELAGSVAEIAHKTLFKNFRNIRPEDAKIYLIESQPELLKTFHPKLGKIARHYLEELGVQVITGTRVTKISEEGIWVGDDFFPSFSIIWAAGNEASSILATLKCPLDHSKRAIVGKDLSIPNHPNIFVIGDSAHAENENGDPYPAIASVAIQQGQYVAKIIKNEIPFEKRKSFKYFDKGSMATIGTSKAVATIHKFNFSGFFAWLSWCFVHILYLVSFKNRIIVVLQWFFLYFFGSRQVRIILRSVFGKENSLFKKVGDHFETSSGAYHFKFENKDIKIWNPKKKTEESPSDSSKKNGN